MIAKHWGNSIRLALSAIAVMTIALVAGGKPLHTASADAPTVSVITAKSATNTDTGKAPASGKRARDAAFDRPSALEARSS